MDGAMSALSTTAGSNIMYGMAKIVMSAVLRISTRTTWFSRVYRSPAVSRCQPVSPADAAWVLLLPRADPPQCPDDEHEAHRVDVEDSAHLEAGDEQRASEQWADQPCRLELRRVQRDGIQQCAFRHEVGQHR